MSGKMGWIGSVALVLAPMAVSGQDWVEFAGAQWAVDYGEVKAERFMGEDALLFRNGRVRLANADFDDGTIEFDLATTGHRSFVGVGFRVEESGRDYEYFYLRPHQTGRFDAMQYTPVDNGLSAWQIYAEHNATGWLARDEWIHVRLEVEGTWLNAYIGDHDEPALTVPYMERSPTAGQIVIVGGFPQAGELDIYPTAFANFSVSHGGTVAAAEEGEPRGNGPAEAIQRWDVSPAFAAEAETITELPWTDEWESIWTHDPEGRLNIGKHRARVQGDYGTAVLARSVIRSDREQIKKLAFGYSDRGSVFLNGELIFTGDNTYLSRSERYLGVMTVDNDALYLPLKAGDNELVVAVTESFGGWGLVARLGDVDGIQKDRLTMR